MSSDPHRADRLCRLFCNIIEDLITARALQDAQVNGLTRVQFNGLQFVHLHPQCCIKDLADGLAVSHPAAVKLVERLADKGLIKRSAHERDRRVVRLSVTAPGGRQAQATIDARGRALQEALQAGGQRCSRDLLNCIETFIGAALSDEDDIDDICLYCGRRHDDDCPVSKAELRITGQLRQDG